MELSIGELVRRSDYAVQTVRYYEQNGLMPSPAAHRRRTAPV